MKIIPCEQGSADWFAARKGVPSASCFDQIICPHGGEPLKKGGHRKMLSDGAAGYACKLIAERLLNRSLDSLATTEWMDRGQQYESMAVSFFEGSYDLETEPVGFITTDDGLLGCSPDRLIKDADAALEVKCPSPAVQLGYLLGKDPLPAAYRPQVMGQMLVGDFDRVEFFTFHPEMPWRRIVTTRDEPYIALMRDTLNEFLELLAKMEARARALGVFGAASEAVTPLEVERAGELADTFKRDFGLTEDFVR